jgi:hypothetical protein
MLGFGHGLDTSMRRRARRVHHVNARLMSCRTVCGARGEDVCMRENAVHALGVHGACSTRSERGRLRGLWPVGAAGIDGGQGALMARQQRLACHRSLGLHGRAHGGCRQEEEGR